MLFGIAGPTAGGKTTVTDMLVETYRAGHLRYSFILSDIASDCGLDPQDKATLQGLYITLRKERGESWLADAVAEKAEDLACTHLVIEGNRRKVDIETLKDVADRRNEALVFIFIDASPETRFARYNARLQKYNKDPISWEEFLELETNPAENEVDDLRQYAKTHGIYIDTDEHNIEQTLTLVKTALQEKGRG